MVLVAVMVKASGAIHVDPRPFVQNPAVKPLFPHPADNGFPSDHTALAIAISVVVWRYRRSVAWVMLVVSVLIGVARVARSPRSSSGYLRPPLRWCCGAGGSSPDSRAAWPERPAEAAASG